MKPFFALTIRSQNKFVGLLMLCLSFTILSSNVQANEQTLEIENGTAFTIPAILTLPEAKNSDQAKFPVVIMLHGTGSDKNEAGGGYVSMAESFAKAGIASIRMDFRGSGTSKADYQDYNISTALNDVGAVMQYIQQSSELDADRIGIMGWSQGGTMALFEAAQNDKIKSVLTWAAATDLTGIITNEMYEEAKKQGYAELKFDWRPSLKLGLKWMDEVKQADIYSSIANIKAPILAINGEKDDVVLPENATKIINASKNNQSEVFIIPNADHTFNIFTDDKTAVNQLIDKTIAWFSKGL